MVRGLKLAGLFVILGAASGCDFVSRKIDGPYLLETIDIPEDTFLCYDLGQDACVGRVDRTVFAVGYNNDYVVAARHPSKFEDDELNRSVTEYYYVVRALDGPYANNEDVVRGPFTFAQFEREKARLQLPNFTTELSSLK